VTASAPPVLEICVDSLASVEICQAQGIPRIELCAGLVEGGTTPSLGFLRAARALYGGRLMKMIRPRAGDFVYSTAELRAMTDDIRAARDHGADGVVFGCLQPDGTVDEPATATLVATAAGMDLTFHRAFDVTRGPAQALESLIRLGIPRILTSGGHPTVCAGMPALAALHHQARGRLSLMAGGGLKPSLLPALLDLGLREFHLSARSSVESPMLYQRPDIPMGAATVPGEYERRQTDPTILQSLLDALSQPPPS